MTWETNTEYLQFGALGWGSKTGEAGFSKVFDGQISDIVITEGVKTPAEVAEILNPTVPEVPDPLVDLVYSQLGALEIASASDVLEIAPSVDLNLASGTIAFSFEADSVGGRKGLVSKDASYYAGGGNHFAAYIEDGVLKVRFQDGSSDQTFEIPGIEANTVYDVQFDFDGTTVNVLLDGVNVGTAEFGMTWETNTEYLQFGALGWGSKTGEAGFGNVFDGTITDIVVTDGVKTPAEVAEIVTAQSAVDPVIYDAFIYGETSNTGSGEVMDSGDISPWMDLFGAEFALQAGSGETVDALTETNVEVQFDLSSLFTLDPETATDSLF
ncbi:LamG-like jellyroll fold domain-containing protein, partial [Primorskyibacter sp. 2E233]|uniref:LamG-like jellyroll fold domain-containing protein n=1 Tax=Primorskyibacter sp. 2E233 TaxID=3413431 RepID=UPI003BF258CB